MTNGHEDRGHAIFIPCFSFLEAVVRDAALVSFAMPASRE
jgi:hypothetical protein